MNPVWLRCCFALLLVGCGMFWMAPVHAANVSCTASMTNAAFGAVNPLASQTTTTATLNYSCSNSAPTTRYATICFSVGAGVQGGGQVAVRQMQDSGGHTLQFQLYQDPSRSVIWGSQSYGGSTPLQVNLTIPANGVTPGSATMYGQVFANQNTVIPGSYQDIFSGGETAITINESSTAFPNTCSSTSAGTFAFTASADPPATCTVSAATLDFGTVGLLTTGVNGTSTVGVQCTSGSPYTIALNNGVNGGGSVRDLKSGSNLITYNIYQDSAHTKIWGASASVLGNTEEHGTGNGSLQNYTAYGAVPAQATPPAGTYNDTITISVIY